MWSLSYLPAYLVVIFLAASLIGWLIARRYERKSEPIKGSIDSELQHVGHLLGMPVDNLLLTTTRTRGIKDLLKKLRRVKQFTDEQLSRRRPPSGESKGSSDEVVEELTGINHKLDLETKVAEAQLAALRVAKIALITSVILSLVQILISLLKP
jgi:hypothetical protein